MKAEDLIKDYMKTHPSAVSERERAKKEVVSKPAKPVPSKGK